MRVFLWVEQIARSRAGTLYGISLDASKCFDRISVWDALAAGAACGIPTRLLGGVGSFYLAHKRFTSIRQHLDPCSWEISRGLIQGCSISVLLTCCVLKTWHDISSPQATCFSFIDDRLILSSEPSPLTATWERSTEWDSEHHWQLNPGKTIQFTQGPPMAKLRWQDSDLAQDTKFQWLGQEFFLAYNQSRTLWPKRLDKAQQALRKLSQLATTPVVKQKVVERAVTPLFAYGLHSTLPPSRGISKALIPLSRWLSGEKDARSITAGLWPVLPSTELIALKSGVLLSMP